MPSYTKSKLGLNISKADLRRDLEEYSQAIEGVSPTVNTQTDWYVNSVTGDDVVGNGTEEAPLQSLVALESKLNTKSEVPINVWLDGDFSSEDLYLDPFFINPDHILSVYGTATEVGSGALTAYTALTVNVDSNILEDTSQDFSQFIKARLRFTSGAAAGAVCWLLKEDPLGGGNDTVRADEIIQFDEFENTTGSWASTVKRPSIGDTYVIETLTPVRSAFFNPAVRMIGTSEYTGRCANLHFISPPGSIHKSLHLGEHTSQQAFILVKCRISVTRIESSGSSTNKARFTKCLFSPALVLFNEAPLYLTHCSNISLLDMFIRGDILKTLVVQGSGIEVYGEGDLFFNASVIVIDTTIGITIPCSNTFRLAYGTFWGVGISDVLADVEAGGLLAVSPGILPTVGGDVRVGTTDDTWANALAAGIDTSIGAGVIPLEV